MALIVEDGTGKPDACSYVSVAYLRAYAKFRNLNVPSSNPECEALLVLAWDAMLGLDYIGTRATKIQAGDFPRDGVQVDGFCYARDELPSFLLNGQCALAIEAQQTDLLPTIGANAAGPVISRTIGPITTVYADTGRVSTRPIINKAKVYLAKLLRSGGNTVRMERG